MRRLIAILLGASLASTAGHVPALHVHAYADHDHPEHHHGLAAHEHQAAAPHRSGGGTYLESCDPGQHAVSLLFVCSAPPHAQAVEAEFTTPAAAAPTLRFHQTAAVPDVRVHGPPGWTQAPPRAPPIAAST